MTRFLIILPVLILADPPLRVRLDMVVREFRTFIDPHDEQTKFGENWDSCVRLRDSKLARLLIAVLVYATAAWLGQYSSRPVRNLSPGGGRRRVPLFLASRYVGILCQLSNIGLFRISLAVAALAMDAILALHDALQPSL